jgi:ATP-binding cassette, subfamily B, bacterial
MAKAFTIFTGHKRKLLFLLLIGASSSIISNVALPLVIKNIIDTGIMGNNLRALGVLSVAALIVIAIATLADFIMKISQAKLQNSIIREVNLQMLESFYKLPYRNIIKHDKGYFISRIYDETLKAVAPLITLVVSTTVIILSILASLSVLFYISWRLGALLTLTIPILYLITNKISRRIRETSNRASEQEARAKGVLERLIGSYKVVNIFNLQDKAKTQYDSLLSRQLHALYSNIRISNIFSSVAGGLAFSTQIFLLMVSGYEIIHGRLTFGSALAISNIYGVLVSSVSGLIKSIPNLQQALATLDRLLEFKALAVTPRKRINANHIAFRDVTFAYGEEETVLKNLNFTINDNEAVLITGRNGSGKTTLAHIMAGFLEPTVGDAHIAGPDHLSVSLFPPTFIPGSLKENICFDNLTDDKKRLFTKLIREFEIADVVEQELEELSAGQKQKASVIMALLKDASVYIFDEPTANIDVQTRKRMLEEIVGLTHGKTLIVIMHCSEDLHYLFDRIINLDQKQVKNPEFAQDGGGSRQHAGAIAVSVTEALDHRPTEGVCLIGARG